MTEIKRMTSLKSVGRAAITSNILDQDLVMRRRTQEAKTSQIRNMVRSITNVGATAMLQGTDPPLRCFETMANPKNPFFCQHRAERGGRAEVPAGT